LPSLPLKNPSSSKMPSSMLRPRIRQADLA
jgi:hypothetical protein